MKSESKLKHAYIAISFIDKSTIYGLINLLLLGIKYVLNNSMFQFHLIYKTISSFNSVYIIY